jgi:hypothetical protein
MFKKINLLFCRRYAPIRYPHDRKKKVLMYIVVTLNVATFSKYYYILGNAGNNEENNCKPDHNRSKLLGHWLVKDK